MAARSRNRHRNHSRSGHRHSAFAAATAPLFDGSLVPPHRYHLAVFYIAALQCLLHAVNWAYVKDVVLHFVGLYLLVLQVRLPSHSLDAACCYRRCCCYFALRGCCCCVRSPRSAALTFTWPSSAGRHSPPNPLAAQYILISGFYSMLAMKVLRKRELVSRVGIPAMAVMFVYFTAVLIYSCATIQRNSSECRRKAPLSCRLAGVALLLTTLHGVR